MMTTNQTILEKGNRNILAQQFKKFIGFKKNVLEVGCGTGQLSIFFSLGTNNECCWSRSNNSIFRTC